MTEASKLEAYIWENEKQKPNQPDHRGKVEVTREFLKEMTELAKAGEEINVNMAGWNRVSKNKGKAYIYFRLEVDTYKKPTEETEAEPSSPEPQKETVTEEFDADKIPF
tara:strand:- start:48 stop:374 length:327 start_codon:yes stop_codon:yes gene_type:complete